MVTLYYLDRRPIRSAAVPDRDGSGGSWRRRLRRWRG